MKPVCGSCHCCCLYLTYISNGIQIGKTKVFLRAGQMAELDALRSKVLGRSAIKIQRKVRSYLARKSFIVLKRSAIQMQAVCRGNVYWLMYYFLVMQ